ncbi:MAG: protein phosphatase 2C domain-containing protein [Victivallaceae bacterium]|nr:protein phosphatase 2C domain-containing protein [Victivallaceae bacterium]
MSRKPVFFSAGETNCGLVREHNEDAFSIFTGKNLLVSAVADGVSCQGHGAVASTLCCEVWHDCAEAADPGFEASPEKISSFLNETLQLANRKILERNAADRIEAETTLCALCLAGDLIGIIHAGDSRAYRLRQGKLQLLTQDHTLAEKYFVEKGCFPREREKYAGMIYRAVGANPELEGDLKVEKIEDGDRFLLCSDGLYRVVDFEEIEAILDKNKTPARAVDRLMRAGLLGGADDNLTAAVVDVKME